MVIFQFATLNHQRVSFFLGLFSIASSHNGFAGREKVPESLPMFFGRKVLGKTLALGTELALRPFPIMVEKILHDLSLDRGVAQG